MMGQVAKQHKLVTDMDKADVMVLNSCCFIQDAEQETIDTLLELKQWKKTSKRKIILAGCYVEIQKDKLLKQYPFIDGIINTGAVSRINEVLEQISKFDGVITIYANHIHNFLGEEQRILSTPPHYAYLKIGEGCNNSCAYCRIPSIRGSALFRPIKQIIEEAEKLADSGVKEIIVVSQDSTMYNYDGYSFSGLLRALDRIDKLAWIRIMYCYPDKISDDLIRTIKASKKIVRYIDMPIQHINDKILNKMNRMSQRKSITNRIDTLREEITDIKLRSTVMVGYPGEDDNDFGELYDYIEETQFDHLGVFAYSQEPGTFSFNMRGQVDEHVKQKRLDAIMNLQKGISKKLNKKYIGQEMDVLIDNSEGGRRYFDAPEIDGFVYVANLKKQDIGQLKKVKIKKALEYDLIGRTT